MRVLIADQVGPECPSMLRAAGFDVREDFGISAEGLKETVKDYEVLVVRSRTKVTREIIEKGQSLKLIGRVGVGLDTIDVKAAEEHGVKVVNTPQMSTIAVAELVMAMMLSLARGVHLANESMKKGLWEKKKFHGFELKGKTLGVVGLGRIGKAVAERARAFEMRVVMYDVIVDEEAIKRIGAVRVEKVEDLLRQSDIVTIHVPLLPETAHMFNEQLLSEMKEGSYLINASRGEVVDTKALLDALKSGRLAGAALDVFEHEPPTDPAELDLVKLPNTITTPHIGAQTAEAQDAGAVLMAENIIKMLKTH